MQDTVMVIHRNGQGSPDYVVLLTFEYREEAGSWVGVCAELGTSAFSDNLEQAKLELREAVELQLNELERPDSGTRLPVRKPGPCCTYRISRVSTSRPGLP